MTAIARNLALLGALSAFCVATTAVAPDAYAAEGQKQTLKRKFKDKIHVVQPKPVLQKMRFELAPRFGMTINDSVVRNYRLGANANFHILESLYIGLTGDLYDFGGALGGETNVFEEVLNQTGTQPESAVLNWFAGAEIGYVPIVGKFSLFNRSIVYYDLAIVAGGGAINAESVQLTTAYTTGGGTVGLQGRFFFNKWIALNLEVRDVIFSAKLNGSDGALTNIASMALGASFFLPTKFKYSDRIVDAPD